MWKISRFLSLPIAGTVLIVRSSGASHQELCDLNDEGCYRNNEEPANGVESKDEDYCRLYLAESSRPNGGLGVYAGVDLERGDLVSESDMMIPLVDFGEDFWKQVKEDNPWERIFSDDLFFGNAYDTDEFVPGLGEHIQCWPELSNVEHKRGVLKDSPGLHRFKDPGAGASSLYHGVDFAATSQIRSGFELFSNCGEQPVGQPILGHFEQADFIIQEFLNNEKVNSTQGLWSKVRNAVRSRRVRSALPSDIKDLTQVSEIGTARFQFPYTVKTPDWLKENGLCMDKIRYGNSKIDQAGRGAFAKQFISEGSLVAPAVFKVLKREDVRMFDIVEIDDGLFFSGDEVGKQLILNFCYGHPESPVLLLPQSPVVNFINHNGTSPNTAIRWSDSLLQNNRFRSLSSTELLAGKSGIIAEFIALRDILPGEEIVIDYGQEWETAWNNHVKGWSPNETQKEYISANDYIKSGSFNVRTFEEQKQHPYPPNLQTACLVKLPAENNGDIGFILSDSQITYDCLLPCDILLREEQFEEKSFTVRINNYKAAESRVHFSHCVLPSEESYELSHFPQEKITMVDGAYTTDPYNLQAFRHEIGFPKDIFPSSWINPIDYLPPLLPGEVSMLTMDDGTQFGEHLYRIGLRQSLRTKLLAYCDTMGITDLFRQLTGPNPLHPGENKYIDLNEQIWYVQGTEAIWNSNMHWVSPGDDYAQQSYLAALGEAGFDEVLEALGNAMKLDGLVCYHVTFIGVSECKKGFEHYDIQQTGGGAFNIIIPLLLVDDSPPELDVYDYNMHYGQRMGLKYNYDWAVAIGDDTYHATSPVDYTQSGNMRLAATVYVADVNEDNVDAILADYTQAYPPRDRELLLSKRGLHWGRGQKLPSYQF